MSRKISLLIPVILLAWCAAARADVNIPFQGVLELDGVLQDGAFDFRLRLYDADTGGSQVYSVTRTGVIVRGGYFSVFIGPLNDNHLAHSELFLALEVKRSADSNYLALQGRQRISPAMYAARAAHGHTFTTGDLSVTGQVNDNLKATGTVTWNCAAGTVRVGNWCVSSVQAAADYQAARIGCHDKGMGLCPVEALADCVIINPPYGGQYCDTVLDGYEFFWTDSIVSHTFTSGNFCLADNMSVYNGSGTCCSGSPGCMSYRDLNYELRYFCCTPVVNQAVLP